MWKTKLDPMYIAIGGFVVLVASWFWFGAIASPWVINEGPWWPATLILSIMALIMTGSAIWYWFNLLKP